VPPQPLIGTKPVVSDEEILAKLHSAVTRRAARGPGWVFVETAGGVHSPSPSKTTQADLYSTLRLPVILIGDSKLGGVSQTISAFEALKVRGYDVEAILLFQDEKYENYRFLSEYFHQKHGTPVTAVPPPPTRDDDPVSDQKNMSQYYKFISDGHITRGILDHLDQRHHERITRLESMSRSAHKNIWYPFTQQKSLTPEGITVIDSARGDYFQVLTPQTADPAGSNLMLQPSFDGSASWWTQGLGHGNPSLALAAAYAAGRYGHVMFAEAIHEPALRLAETLLRDMQNPRLTRAFYSDNGSTGVEVALKMGLRAARVRYGWAADEKLGILGLKGGYHGDTMGAMDASEPSTYNEKVEWYEGKGFWFDYPSVKCTGGKWVIQVPDHLKDQLSDRQEFSSLAEVLDVEARDHEGQAAEYERYIVDTLKKLHEQGRKFGCLVMEPIVLGAGGMAFV
jgi:dethiobiotin synthetase/adenosylmethionine--8-amino-7-oxononanoate aminotransferase